MTVRKSGVIIPFRESKKRIAALEAENRRLKEAVADLAFDVLFPPFDLHSVPATHFAVDAGSHGKTWTPPRKTRSQSGVARNSPRKTVTACPPRITRSPSTRTRTTPPRDEA